MATFVFFNNWKETQLDASHSGGNTPVDFDTDDIRLSLVTNSNPPDATSDQDWADLSATEVSGGGYTAGGFVFTTQTVTETAGTVKVDLEDATFSQNGTGFTNARFAILYKFDATAADAPIIGFIDFTSDKGNTSGDLTIQWNTAGVFTLA